MTKDNNIISDISSIETLSAREAERLVQCKAIASFPIVTSKEFVDWALGRNMRNRDVKQSLVNDFAKQMKGGKWVLTHQGIGFSASGVLRDGQHRLLANRKAGYPEVKLMVCFGEPEEAQMYIDQHCRRTNADVLSVMSGVHLSHEKAAVVAWLRRMELEAGDKKIPMSELIDTYGAYSEDIDDVYRKVNVRGMTAVFFAALAYARHIGVPTEKLVAFREGCATGALLNVDSPCFAWRKYCLEQQHGVSTTSIHNARLYAVCNSLAAFVADSEKCRLPSVRPGTKDYIDALHALRAASRTYVEEHKPVKSCINGKVA